MSALAPFVRSFRALSKAVRARSDAAVKQALTNVEEGKENEGSELFVSALTLAGLASALSNAATDLEQQIAADIARLSKE